MPAFFAPGLPTLLDGSHATYDGFRPDTETFLTIGQLDTLQSKIYDYHDDNTLGEFFVGLLSPNDAALFDIDQSDIFRKINGFRVGSRGFNVTINGLPNVTSGPTGGTSAASLAALQPAAGGNTTGQ